MIQTLYASYARHAGAWRISLETSRIAVRNGSPLEVMCNRWYGTSGPHTIGLAVASMTKLSRKT
jgi:hypothetical protein